MQEFTVNFPLVVRLDESPGDAWPHEIGYHDTTVGLYRRLDSADDEQLKRMGIAKPTPTLRRGDVLRDNETGLHYIVNAPELWRRYWRGHFTVIAHVALDEVTP